MLDFRFTNAPNGRNKDAVAGLLVQPRLWVPDGDYPGHMEWREKALEDIAAETKRAMVAYWGSEAVGSVVYQRHPDDPATVEIRNLSVEQHARGRHVASFLLAQVECEAVRDFPGAESIIGDTKLANGGLISFLSSRDYAVSTPQVLEAGSFAHNGEPDVVFSKQLPRLGESTYLV